MTKKFLVILTVIIFAAAFNYKAILKNFYPVKYEKEVIKYSKQYGLNPNLVYSLIKIESKYNPYAKSQKGAIGLMQITPNTGQYISKLIKDTDFKDEKLYDPELNIRYGCFYMSKLLRDFEGNIDCMLAAYNGGEGNVRKWIKHDSSGKICLESSLIPFSETKEYVIKVKNNYKIYKFLYK